MWCWSHTDTSINPYHPPSVIVLVPWWPVPDRAKGSGSVGVQSHSKAEAMGRIKPLEGGVRPNPRKSWPEVVGKPSPKARLMEVTWTTGWTGGRTDRQRIQNRSYAVQLRRCRPRMVPVRYAIYFFSDVALHTSTNFRLHRLLFMRTDLFACTQTYLLVHRLI